MSIQKVPITPAISNLSAKISIFGVPELNGGVMTFRICKDDTKLLMMLFNIRFWQDDKGNFHWSRSGRV